MRETIGVCRLPVLFDVQTCSLSIRQEKLLHAWRLRPLRYRYY